MDAEDGRQWTHGCGCALCARACVRVRVCVRVCVRACGRCPVVSARALDGWMDGWMAAVRAREGLASHRMILLPGRALTTSLLPAFCCTRACGGAQGDDVEVDDQAGEQRKKRTFRKFAYRGVDLEQLMDLPSDKLVELFPCRVRRRFARGLKRKPMALIKRLRKAKKETAQDEKPETIKTHLRNMIIVPEMIGSVVGVYNGKVFNQVEIKPEMVGFYLGEFSITYKPVKHGRPGIGATHSSRFIPLK